MASVGESGFMTAPTAIPLSRSSVRATANHRWVYSTSGMRTDTCRRFPYERSDGDLICIDDAENEYYNMVVDMRDKGLDAAKLPSHEDMVRTDDLYKYTVFVEHNAVSTEPGAGSCIFLHLWSGEDSHTAGCTAMSEPDMVDLLSWLDPEKKPVLVQLTLRSYMRLREKWGLPGME